MFVFVNLASIMQPDQVGIALADALEIQQVANRTIPQLIGDHLKASVHFCFCWTTSNRFFRRRAVVSEIA